jgi:hypothetical protein
MLCFSVRVSLIFKPIFLINLEPTNFLIESRNFNFQDHLFFEAVNDISFQALNTHILIYCIFNP